MKNMNLRAKSPSTASSEYMTGAPTFKPKESSLRSKQAPFKRVIPKPMLPRIESSKYIEEESETESKI